MNESKERDDLLVELADTAWVLGHWYMIAIPNSRALADFSALAAMGQEALGFVRSLFERLDESAAIHHEGRSQDMYRSAPFMDSAPSDWADFVVSVIATECVLRIDAAELLKDAEDEEAGLLRMLDQVATFHLGYAHGWLDVLRAEAQERVQAAISKRGPRVWDWVSARHSASDSNSWADLESLLPRPASLTAAPVASRAEQRDEAAVPAGLAEFMSLKPAVIKSS